MSNQLQGILTPPLSGGQCGAGANGSPGICSSSSSDLSSFVFFVFHLSLLLVYFRLGFGGPALNMELGSHAGLIRFLTAVLAAAARSKRSKLRHV